MKLKLFTIVVFLYYPSHNESLNTNLLGQLDTYMIKDKNNHQTNIRMSHQSSSSSENLSPQHSRQRHSPESNGHNHLPEATNHNDATRQKENVTINVLYNITIILNNDPNAQNNVANGKQNPNDPDHQSVHEGPDQPHSPHNKEDNQEKAPPNKHILAKEEQLAYEGIISKFFFESPDLVYNLSPMKIADAFKMKMKARLKKTFHEMFADGTLMVKGSNKEEYGKHLFGLVSVVHKQMTDALILDIPALLVHHILPTLDDVRSINHKLVCKLHKNCQIDTEDAWRRAVFSGGRDEYIDESCAVSL